ncbi:YdiU family protein [Methylopila musalis]|uniref:Protein nucleotidyltransferase YdiU n=1 Tax=Methylopila musalis TaxID=1134781 RepID=A0ABW3Z5E0_9HYPH
MPITIRFDNSYARLPETFHHKVAPTPVAAPRLIALNRPLATELGLDAEALDSPEGAAIFGGVRAPGGAEPLAAAYAGHQFGGFVPQLGDGRAILLGEVIDVHGARRDIQLKGAGLTRFSRRGDGRAALGPVLREYLVSEAMHALGVPTTRALAAVSTGEAVIRERVLPGAVLTRVASSHIRVGTFQYFAALGDVAGLRTLADHAIARHYPAAGDAERPYLALLEAVIERQAALIAKWLLVGFVHGVMNTDNMSIAGETIDYGPCAFLDAYDPAASFSSIDEFGRYAYANQPNIGQWNLTRLAESLLPLLDPDPNAALEQARGLLKRYPELFNVAYLDGLRAKLGFAEGREEDLSLVQDLLDLMARDRADYTLTFRRLARAAERPEGDAALNASFADAAGFDGWSARWRARLSAEGRAPDVVAAAMRRVNPAIIPRNHRVEAVIAAAVERDDFAPFEELRAATAAPYDDRPAFAAYADPAPEDFGPYRTFCGT